jgi:hypothetical protein
LASGLFIVPLVFLPRGKKFDLVLAAALVEGQVTPKLRAELDDRVVNFAHLYENILVVVVVALMVFKPF